MTTLHTIDPTSDPSWGDLMRATRGSAFGAPPWFTAIVDSYGFDVRANVLRDDSGATCAGIAYAELDDFLGSRLVSVPFCDYLDPVVADAAQWNQLVDPLIERGLPFQVKVLDADVPRADTRFVPVDELAYHSTDLARSEEDLFAAFERRARQNVRSAPRHGVTVRFGTDLEDVRQYHDLHRRTRKYKHSLLAQPLAFFENIWKQFAPNDGVVIGFAEHEGDVIAAAFYLLWDDVWYFKFSASVFERSGVRPNEYLAWESMRLAMSRGCVSYDWGVSDLEPPGLVQYKRKLGTEERRMTVLRHVPEGYANPHADEIKPILGELTGLLTRSDVPDDVTQRAGEILYRYFT
jgi:CelD/BcsL family acetyltransferase involved in cellulose biosynthesis